MSGKVCTRDCKKCDVITECYFTNSNLQSHIDSITSDNVYGTVIEQLEHSYGLIKSASRTKPQSQFWKDAVDYIAEKLAKKNDKFKQWLKDAKMIACFKDGKGTLDICTLLEIFYATDKEDGGGGA